MTNLNIVSTVETRITEPVTIRPSQGGYRLHVAVRGIEGVVLAKAVKVTALKKGGYSVRLLGNGALVQCKGTDYLMVADGNGVVKVTYIYQLFS